MQQCIFFFIKTEFIDIGYKHPINLLTVTLFLSLTFSLCLSMRPKSRTPIVICHVVSVLQCDRARALRVIYSFHSGRKMTK